MTMVYFSLKKTKLLRHQYSFHLVLFWSFGCVHFAAQLCLIFLLYLYVIYWYTYIIALLPCYRQTDEWSC